MREVFRREDQPRDPGAVFYTITAEDIGKRFIHTEAGTVSLADVIGYVLPADVGKRLVRTRGNDGVTWFWQCETAGQRDLRRVAEPEAEFPGRQGSWAERHDIPSTDG